VPRWLIATTAVVAIGVGVGVALYADGQRRAQCWADARRECGERCRGSLEEKMRDAPPELKAELAKQGLRPGDLESDAGAQAGLAVGAMLDPTTRACVDACSRRVATRNECGSDPG